jgi:hypothetical protein
MPQKTLEVWVAVDAEGQYEAGTTDDDACDRFDGYDGGRGGVTGYRLIKVLVTVPLPGPLTATAALRDDEVPVATAEAP